jgi:hypothetical protein
VQRETAYLLRSIALASVHAGMMRPVCKARSQRLNTFNMPAVLYARRSTQPYMSPQERRKSSRNSSRYNPGVPRYRT